VNARARVLIAFAGVLAFGAALGVAADRLWLAQRPAVVAADPMTSADALVAVMQREVGLDEAQARTVRQILARHQASVDSAWLAVRPNVHRAIGAAQMEIAMVLRADQRARYLRWVQSAHRGM
jgi:hypothetical protein